METLTKQEIISLVAAANGKTSRFRAANISDAIGIAFRAMNEELDAKEEVTTYLSIVTGKIWDPNYKYRGLLPSNHPLSENSVLNQEEVLNWIEADPGLYEEGLIASAQQGSFDSVYAMAKLQVLANIGIIDVATYEGLKNIELEDM